MTCRELFEFLIDYESGALPPDRRRVFDEHLAVCPQCVDYLENYRAVIALGRDALAPNEAPPPADVPEELIRAILAAQSGDPR